jgi:hypothetical protein
MQTFLPYPCFRRSVESLDNKRLGKQRVEAMQLVNATIKIQSGEVVKGWANHPARIMWDGKLDALKLYHNLAIVEWCRRGFRNTMKLFDLPDRIELPWWIFYEDFHSSHRSNLLRKDPTWYGRYGWVEPNNLPYIWPTPHKPNQ